MEKNAHRAEFQVMVWEQETVLVSSHTGSYLVTVVIASK